jgi:hypothetical protein
LLIRNKPGPYGNEGVKYFFAQFIEQNTKQNHDVFFWTNEMIRWEAEQFEKIGSKIALADWLKKLKEMEIFHQPSATKWTLFYSYLQTHVLPRL